jgi:hypothetical protein
MDQPYFQRTFAVENCHTFPWLMLALTIFGLKAACIRLARWAKFFSNQRSETSVPDRHVRKN